MKLLLNHLERIIFYNFSKRILDDFGEKIRSILVELKEAGDPKSPAIIYCGMFFKSDSNETVREFLRRLGDCRHAVLQGRILPIVELTIREKKFPNVQRSIYLRVG